MGLLILVINLIGILLELSRFSIALLVNGIKSMNALLKICDAADVCNTMKVLYFLRPHILP